MIKRFKNTLRTWLPAPLAILLKYVKNHLARTIGDHFAIAHHRDKVLLSMLGFSCVQDGPFQGMRYIRSISGTKLLPKLLGSYEKELWPAVERILCYQTDLVVDIGSAEGYYVVGLAYRLQHCKVVAYDTASDARYYCRQLAGLNGVMGQVLVQGCCDVWELERQLCNAKRPVVISDCEGYELEVLRPDYAPSLMRAVILVELHDFLIPGITTELWSRFELTHDVTTYTTQPRTIADIPEGISLSPEEACFAMDEERPFMQWYLLWPRDSR